MTPFDRDELNARLQEASEIYTKKITPGYVRVWVNTLSGQSNTDVMAAFDEHFRSGKYMPKPSDILAIIGTKKELRSDKYQKPENFATTDCDPLIAKAWSIYMKLAFDWNVPGHKAKEDEMDMDTVLDIVNREASKHGRPDALLPEHRMQEYFGNQAGFNI